MRTSHCQPVRMPYRAGILVSLCCVVALAGCGSSAPSLNNTPKATAIVTVTATAAPYPTVQPASTEGWAIYTDKRFHFRAPIPPGWKAKAYTTYECPQGGDGNYVVGFYPPDVGVPQDNPFRVRESMAIYLPLCAMGEEGVSDPISLAEPGGVLIGATRAPYYNHDGYQWISRYTVADFGGQAYIFNFDAMPQDKGLRDLPLFLGMLASFKYLG